jgi:hypothetical protein
VSKDRERVLGAVAISGAVVFAVVVIGESLLRTDRSVSRDFVSEYAVGAAGWIQTVAFLVLASAEFALALGLWRAGKGDRVAYVGSLLLALVGAADVVSAIFETDLEEAVTTSGKIHNTVGIASFLVLVIAMFLLSRLRRLDDSWATARRASFVSGILGLVCFVLIGAGDSGGWPGIPQRVFILVFLTWYALLGLRLNHAAQANASRAETA